MIRQEGAAATESFVNRDRRQFRAAPWWTRLAYIVRALPKAIAQLIGEIKLPAQARILDYGCAEMPYRDLFPADADYVGADLAGNADARVLITAQGTLPVESESFDLVLSSQVLEHVSDPALYLSECFRVLRPGGQLLLSTHGMMLYHPDPVDYWRWTGAGLQRVVGLAGFKVKRFTGIVGLAALGLQFFQDATYKHLPRFLQPPYILVLQLLVALFDRQSPQAREYNALVFALIAEKPLSPA